MFFTRDPIHCADCGGDLDPLVPPWCMICHGWFCPRHLTFINNVGTCLGCRDERTRRETAGIIEPSRFDRIVRLLGADTRATVGINREQIVVEEATRLRLYAQCVEGYDDDVVDAVQQRLHDEFIDTSWPACPEHPNHPLWFSDGWWRCTASGTAVAKLGELLRTR